MSMNRNNRFSSIFGMQWIILFEISIGIIANIILLFLHVVTFLLEHKTKPTDLTIVHLALIHIVFLVSVSFLSAETFGHWELGNDIICTFVIYVNRLMKGLSISTTCLLSVLQAITLSPRNSCLSTFKQKSLHQYMYVFLFLWLFNMLVCGRYLISKAAIANVTSRSLMFITQTCSLLPVSSFVKYIFLTLMIFQQMSLTGLMGLSSMHMVILLCKHKKQSQHLHSTRQFPKASPEKRATRTILLLMGFFTVIYCMDCVMHSMSSITWNYNLLHHSFLALVGNAYATVSPLVLISSEMQMIKRLIHAWES